MQLIPDNGDGIGTIPLTVYPLEDDGAGVASAGDITPTLGSVVEGNHQVKINNILSEAFTITTTDTVATVTAKMETAINAVPEMPVIATDGTTVLDVASKWKGASANDIVLEMVSPTGSGVTWAFIPHLLTSIRRSERAGGARSRISLWFGLLGMSTRQCRPLQPYRTLVKPTGPMGSS
jgi:phage tail sheath gpL-like